MVPEKLRGAIEQERNERVGVCFGRPGSAGEPGRADSFAVRVKRSADQISGYLGTFDFSGAVVKVPPLVGCVKYKAQDVVLSA
jgi:hypothetical protein